MAAVAPVLSDGGPDRRPRLRLAAAPPQRTKAPTFADAVYAATLALLLAAGILGVLLLNTATQTQADRIAAQRQHLAALALQAQAAQVALDREAVPAAVEARARALQMRPAAAMPILRLSRTATFAPPRPRVTARVQAAGPVRAG